MIEPMNVGLREASTMRIGWKAASVPGQRTRLNKSAALSPTTKPIIFELHQHTTGKVIINLSNVDV